MVFTTNRQRNGDLVDNGYEQAEVTDQQLCTVVSLRPLQTGDLPEFGEVDDVLKSKTLGGVRDLLDKVRSAVDEHPFTLFARPSPERYGLLGYVEVAITPR